MAFALPEEEDTATTLDDVDDDETVSSTLGTVTSAETPWRSFEHPRRLFSLRIPRAWKTIQPLSEDAAFAAASPDGRVLFEVLVFEAGSQMNGLEVLAALPDIMVSTLLMEHSDVREVWRRDAGSQTGIWSRLIVEYTDRIHPTYDASTLFTTDYFFLGSEERILLANFKALTLEYKDWANLFELIVRRISVPGEA